LLRSQDDRAIATIEMLCVRAAEPNGETWNDDVKADGEGELQAGAGVEIRRSAAERCGMW